MRFISTILMSAFIIVITACGGGGGGGNDTTAPTAATCSFSPDTASTGTSITATCTGVETGGSVSIAGMACGAESNGTVTCTGNAENLGSDPSITTKDAAGNSTSSIATGGFTLDNSGGSAQASAARSIITATSTFIDQNASTGTTITVQLKDSSGNNISSGGDTVALMATGGTLGAISDNGNGTYTASLITNDDLTALTVTGQVNGLDISDSARIAIKVSTSTATSAVAILGEKIFTDENLSTPIGQSCASCHDVTSGKFSDIRANNVTSEGAESGEFGGRNSPIAGYAAHTPDLILVGGNKLGGQFWDGRTNSLEEQARQPFLDTREMGNPNKATVINKIKNALYADEFETVFGTDSLDNVDTAFVQMSEAIAAFERTRIFSPFTSKWDAVQAGTATFTPAEARGFQAFKDGRCDTCHFTPDDLLGAQVFSNFKYENIGVPGNPTNPLLLADSAFRDFGAGSAPANPEDGPHFVNPPGTGKGQFKVPSLRNIAVTSPYMHNGIFTTLEQVIDFYNSESIAGIDTTAEVPDTITDGGQYFDVLFETGQEKADLKAFLETLTDAGL